MVWDGRAGYLDNEPVVARPPSRLYKFQKTRPQKQSCVFRGHRRGPRVDMRYGDRDFFWYQERHERQRAVAAEQAALTAEEQQTRLRLEAKDRERITQAAFLISQNKMQEADELAGKVAAVRPSLETESVFRTLGKWHALNGHWTQAAARFHLLLHADQKDDCWAITDDLLMAGPILIERGDMQGYERFRRAAVTRYEGTTDAIFAELPRKSACCCRRTRT